MAHFKMLRNWLKTTEELSMPYPRSPTTRAEAKSSRVKFRHLDLNLSVIRNEKLNGSRSYCSCRRL